jgi:dTDP-4-amino-4,6-dideoxygalactose transaminase
MRRVMELAAAHKLSIIEDAAQCPGALVQGRRVGTWGDVGVLSFGGSKLLTAGRGGAVLTGRSDVHQRMRRALLRGNLVCPLSELQAAVLLPQLMKLDERNAHRLANVARLTQMLAEVPGLVPLRNQVTESMPGYYKLGLQYQEEDFGLPRKTFVAAQRAEGIAFDEGFPSAHIGRSEKRFGRFGDLHKAERAHHGMVVLHHPVLLGGHKELEEIRDAVLKIRHHRELLQG